MIKTFTTSLNQRTEPHTHVVHELIVGRSGKALVYADSKQHVIDSGKTVLIPAGITHYYSPDPSEGGTELLFVCFDNKPLEQHLSTATLMDFQRNLAMQVSSAQLSDAAAQEVGVLTAILKETLKEVTPYSLEKAGHLLGSILANHLIASGQPRTSDNPEKFEKIRKLLIWINDNLGEDIDIENSAARSHMSRSTFTRYFKQYTNHSLSVYVANLRLNHASELLTQVELPVSEIAFKCGFNNLGHFYSQFQKQYGMTPNQYRKVALEMRL